MGRILSDRNLSKIWVGFLLVLAAILIVVYYIDSTPPPGSTRISARDGMVQVYVPAGPFLMGLKKETAAADCLRYERACDAINFAGAEPEHNITLTSFWIDRTEVTNRQYRLCVAAGACRPPMQNNSWSHPDYFNNSEFDHFPVIYVSWFDARDYCTWAGRRLPGEAEWEKAARGADGRLYPWGNGTVSGLRANFADKNFPDKYAYDREDDGYKDIAPVGSYPAGASPYGVMDLAGNVHEWVSSLFKPYPYIAGDGREDANQPGERVVRGNALDSDITLLRSAGRSSLPPDKRYDYLGFRCAGDN